MVDETRLTLPFAPRCLQRIFCASVPGYGRLAQYEWHYVKPRLFHCVIKWDRRRAFAVRDVSGRLLHFEIYRNAGLFGWLKIKWLESVSRVAESREN